VKKFMGILAVIMLSCFLLASCDDDGICDSCDNDLERELCEELVDECNDFDTDELREECRDDIDC
jgi:hypothetical protein